MPQLRWTLLILGALFLAGLALWESLRGRRARQAAQGRLPGEDSAVPERPRDVEDVPLPSFSARDPERERVDGALPVYEMPPEAPVTGRRLDPILDFEADALAADESGPTFSDSVLIAETDEQQEAAPALVSNSLPHVEVAGAVLPSDADALEVGAGRGAIAALDDGFEIGPVREIDPPVPAARAWPLSADEAPAVARVKAEAAPVLLPPVTEPIVEWPDPEHSQVLSVRMLAPREKFLGRAVRLALTAQGFLPGRFAIYHKPAQNGRVVLSVASLTKPGTFEDPPQGDMQRFSGLNLFTVLPGPLPPVEAVEELLRVAQSLAERLQARLADDRGEPLSASRVQELRALAAGLAS